MQLKLTGIILLFIFTLTICYLEPAMANKFETIGSGVSGSSNVKIEYLKGIAIVAGIIMFIAATLAVVTRNRNTLTLNHTMWKSSSIILFLLGLISIGTGIYL